VVICGKVPTVYIHHVQSYVNYTCSHLAPNQTLTSQERLGQPVYMTSELKVCIGDHVNMLANVVPTRIRLRNGNRLSGRQPHHLHRSSTGNNQSEIAPEPRASGRCGGQKSLTKIVPAKARPAPPNGGKPASLLTCA